MNAIQRSIAKLNDKLFAYRREVAVRLKHKREVEEQASAALELVVDDVLFQTGLKPTKENLPLIGAYVRQVVRDTHREPDEDDGIEMKEFEL